MGGGGREREAENKKVKSDRDELRMFFFYCELLVLPLPHLFTTRIRAEVDNFMGPNDRFIDIATCDFFSVCRLRIHFARIGSHFTVHY